MMNRQFSLAVLLLVLAPTAYGCVNFRGVLDFGDYGIKTVTEAQIFDNGQQVCASVSYGTFDTNGELPFQNCGTSAAVWDWSNDATYVRYQTPDGAYTFPLNLNIDGQQYTYTACEYGCDGKAGPGSTCFVS